MKASSFLLWIILLWSCYFLFWFQIYCSKFCLFYLLFLKLLLLLSFSLLLYLLCFLFYELLDLWDLFIWGSHVVTLAFIRAFVRFLTCWFLIFFYPFIDFFDLLFSLWKIGRVLSFSSTLYTTFTEIRLMHPFKIMQYFHFFLVFLYSPGLNYILCCKF